MKIITLMKMSCKFWSSYFYERSLYKLVVNRKNKYLDEKRAIIESTFSMSKNDNINNNSNNHIIHSDKINFNFSKPIKSRNYSKNNNRYTSYCIWFGNRFCKGFYLNKEAKQKRMMLCEILGLDNYLLHLDYIDRQILLEQKKNNKSNNVVNCIREVNNNNINTNKFIESESKIISPKSQRNKKNNKYFQLVSE